LDLEGDKALVDKQNKLAGDHPSSNSNGLKTLASLNTERTNKPTKTAPHITIICVKCKYLLEIFNGFVELLLGSEDTTDRIHCGDGSWVCSKRVFIG
jgi:hypothetical protein